MSQLPRKGRSHLAQRGQALTEFLVISVALLPLLLLIPVIAKYQDIAHATQMASRYAAFDSLVSAQSQAATKPVSQLQDEVRRRFFSTSDAPIKTRDVAGDFKAHQNLFWRTPDDKPLIANFSDVTLSQSMQGTHDGAGGSGPFSKTMGQTGIHTSTITVKLANLPAGLKFYEPFDKINLVMARRTSVLADTWTGKDPGDVQGRVESLLFDLKPATDAVKLALTIAVPLVELSPVTSPPRMGDLDFWKGQVPPDLVKKPR